jgi:DNA repair protein RecO (recombination protein O)
MGLISTKAIVLSSLKYADADLIVKCFTEDHGLKSYLLRNILASKKGKLRPSMFQPLTQLEIVANHKEKNSLNHIREAKTLHPYRTIQTQIHKSSIAIFIAEVLRNSIQEEEANPGLYTFLEKSLVWLDEKDRVVNFHLLFLVKLSRFLGFYPYDHRPGETHFNLLEGVFQEKPTNEYCISNENVQILKQLMGMGFEDLPKLEIDQSQRVGFLESMMFYYELHLQGFRKPKSLEVLNEVFG